LRVASSGVRAIGRLHAELLARRRPASRGRVHDPVAGVGRGRVGARPGRLVAGSVEELPPDDLDAVAICSSTDTHAGPVVAAAARAGKAIFCEKPVSLDLGEVDRALAAVAGAGVPFQIGFNRRFDPAHQSVRDAGGRPGPVGRPAPRAGISSRDPGTAAARPTCACPGRDLPGHDDPRLRHGPLRDGSEVVEVFARGAVASTPASGEAGDVDTAVVTLTHANGCLTTIDNSRQATYGYDQRVEVIGSRGMAASENPPAHTAVIRTAAGSAGAGLPHFFLERYATSYERAWEAFVTALRAGEPPPVGPADGRAPLVVGLAAWRSVREDRPVQVQEIDREVVGA
jgi:myo-inositol 2-dehydrogenase/D-chiro-inositol 1-dehydrogenase